ncbi:unnamed protein product [Chondrus crispus]|uniref:Uncharacterized protein n=1 Tax=Chondrus crispus TaxID=2769 RepID=R7QLG8_CHOCR|nr:unnamed protein product [Chondrus crispus]CDF38245.1 unnamed protein product [Chondrus crispus]|eukprot:XP_005718130.1 unnamed protein product [Chondrus crispus]
MIVKEPIPGRTRFFNVSVPAGPALMRQTEARSKAVWPCSPQMRIWRSYFWAGAGEDLAVILLGRGWGGGQDEILVSLCHEGECERVTQDRIAFIPSRGMIEQ